MKGSSSPQAPLPIAPAPAQTRPVDSPAQPLTAFSSAVAPPPRAAPAPEPPPVEQELMPKRPRPPQPPPPPRPPAREEASGSVPGAPGLLLGVSSDLPGADAAASSDAAAPPPAQLEPPPTKASSDAAAPPGASSAASPPPGDQNLDQNRRADDGGQAPDTGAAASSAAAAAEEPAEASLRRYRAYGMPPFAVVERHGDVFFALPQDNRTRFIGELLQLRANYFRDDLNLLGPGAHPFVLKPSSMMKCYKKLQDLFEQRDEVQARAKDYSDQIKRGKKGNLSKARRQWFESWLRQNFGGQLWAKILLSAGTVTAVHVSAVNQWNAGLIQEKERREPDEERERPINDSVLRRPDAGPAQARPRVSRQQPPSETLGPGTDYWGGDQRNGDARTVLHFAMQ